MRTLPLAMALIACQNAKDTDGIEITGYLDASRISVTTASDPTAGSVTVVVAGAPGAAEAETLTITNLDSSGSVDASVSKDGSFAEPFAATVGETLQLDAGADPIELVFDEPVPFPAYVSINPHAPDADRQVAVTVELASPHPDMAILVSNYSASRAAWLSVDDAIYTGSILGDVGDLLWVQAFTPEDKPTLAVEIPVPAN